MYMAELRGKLALDSGTPADRTEDTLTAAVFGALRYLPRSALLAVLNRAFRGDFNQEEVNETRFEFWPWLGDVEPDLLLTAGKKVIVIEAKFGAPFSGSDGDIENHQLTREYRAARRRSQARRQQGPWLLAVTSDWLEPPDLQQVRQYLQAGGSEAVPVAWLSWQSIANELDHWKPGSTPERELLSDVLSLMDRRGVRRVFEGFRDEDYWVVSAAQHIAAERVYPAIATFAKQLNEKVNDIGIRWGPNDQGVVQYQSLSLQYPWDWARSYIQLPYWANDWPQRRGFWASLYVLFDFVDSSIAIGYLQKVPSVATAKIRWVPKAEEIASSVRSLPSGYQAAFSSSNYAANRISMSSAELTAGVVVEQVQRPAANLRLERRLTVRELQDVEQAVTLLSETKRMIDERPGLFAVILPFPSDSGLDVAPTDPAEDVADPGVE
jgi:hypothetical protein